MKQLLALLSIGLSTTFCYAETLDFYIGCVGSGDGSGIFRSTLDTETGKVSTPERAASLKRASFLHLSPDRKQLLSTCKLDTQERADGGMALFSIAEDGSLTQTGQASTHGSGSCHVNFDATGKIALAANYGLGGVASAAVGSDGSLTTVSYFEQTGSGPHEKRQRGSHAHSIYAGPENNYAYSADLGTDSVFIYKMDTASANLTPAGEAKTPPGAGPRHLKFSTDKTHVYVLNELNTTISVFERIADGQLKKVQDLYTLPVESKNDGITCSEIVVHPSGQLVFAANRDTTRGGGDTIAAFRVAADNRLTFLGVTPTGVSIPRTITLSPKGDWLIVCGQHSQALNVFAVDAETGKLTQTGEPIPCPRPMCVVFLKE